jgi:hypothetical protein
MVSMRNLLRTLMTVLAGLAPALCQEEQVEWLDNYQKAVEEAKRTQKPIFLEFRCEA